MALIIRPITFTPSATPVQTRYLPANATLRPISYAAPALPTTERRPGLTQAEPAEQGTLTQQVIAQRAQETVNRYPSAPFRTYEVSGGYWYGVSTIDGMETRTKLNVATASTSPDPNARYRTSSGSPTFSEGSAGWSQVGASAKPTAPAAGSTKAEYTAYSQALASWEREQLWRSIPESATWSDISDWYSDARFDLPTQERRAYEILNVTLPHYVSAKQQVIEQQYAAQRQVIVSSNGGLVPTGSGDYRNQSTGQLFSTPSGKAASAAGAAVLNLGRTVIDRGIIGQIAFNIFGSDYVYGRGLPSKPTQQQAYTPTYVNPFQGVPVLEQSAAVGNLMGSMWPGARAASQQVVSAGQGFFSTAPVLSGFYQTGQYVGLDLKIGQLSKELKATVPAFEQKWESKIQGETFTGSEQEYTQFQQEYSALKLKSDLLESHIGQQTALKQQMFGGKTPSVEQMVTYPVYSSAREFANWYAPNVAKPITDYWSTHTAKRYGNLYPHISLIGIPVASAVVSEPAEALAGVAMLVPGAERLARISINEPSTVPAYAGMGLYLQAQGLYEGFTTKPAKTFVNLAYSAGYMHVATAGAKFISPIGAEVVRIPTGKVTKSYNPQTGEMVETPITTNVYGVYAKNPFAGMVFRPTDILRFQNPVHVIDFMGTRALGGYIPGKGAFIGSPVGRFGETPIGSGFLPMTKGESAFARPIMESRISPKHLGVYHEAQNVIELSMKKITNPGPIREYGTMKPESISWDTFNRVVDYIEEHRADIAVYGSTTHSVYLPRSRKTLGDIDLDIRPNVAEQISYDIYDIVRADPAMRGIGPLVRETSQLTGGRWTARHPTEGIILDLHPHWQAEWDVAHGIQTTQRGIKVVPMYETVGGKIFFSTNYREIVPGKQAIIEFGEGRFKDPADMSIIFGNLAEMEISRPLKWDINRIRFGQRQALAQRYLNIGRAYERYTIDFVGKQEPQAVQFLQEAGFPASRANLGGARFADVDMKIGSITEFVKTDARFTTPDKSWMGEIESLKSDYVRYTDAARAKSATFKAQGIDIGITPEAKVLELGPGSIPLKETTHFIESDYIPREEFTGYTGDESYFIPKYKGKIGIGRDFTKQFRAKPDYFDAVFAQRAERTLFNPKTMAEIYRTMKPGGNLIFSGHMMPERVSLIKEAGFEILESNVDPLGRGGSIIARKPSGMYRTLPKYEYQFKAEPKTTYKPIYEKVAPIGKAAPSPTLSPLASTTSYRAPSPAAYIGSWVKSPSYAKIGTYSIGGYQSSPVSKYVESGYTKYPTGGKYSGGGSYKSPIGKYINGGKYPGKSSYRPISGKYTSPAKYIGKPSYKPPESYPTRTAPYPSTAKTTTYPGKTLKVEYKQQAPSVSYQQITKVESYIPTAQYKPPTPTTTTPKSPVIFPPSSPIFMFPISRKIISKKEEEKYKTPKLRTHFDVRGSKWIIKNPIPRPEVVLGGEKGTQYRNELRIYDKQYSKKGYTVHLPFDVIRDYKITKGVRF